MSETSSVTEFCLSRMEESDNYDAESLNMSETIERSEPLVEKQDCKMSEESFSLEPDQQPMSAIVPNDELVRGLVDSV